MKDLKPLNNLINARIRCGLTQNSLAKKAKISRGMLSNIERGYTLPSLPVAHRISKTVNKSIEYLFFEDDVQKMSV